MNEMKAICKANCNLQSRLVHLVGSVVGRRHSFHFPVWPAGRIGCAWLAAEEGRKRIQFLLFEVLRSLYQSHSRGATGGEISDCPFLDLDNYKMDGDPAGFRFPISECRHLIRE